MSKMKIKSNKMNKASHVYSGDGCRHKSLLHSGHNDNSGSNRDKNIQLIRDNVWRKYKI